MKNFTYLLICLLGLTNGLNAQSTDDNSIAPIVIDENWPEVPRTMIKEKSTHGIYIATAAAYGQLGDNDLVQVEGRFGYIADSKLDLSFVGQVLATEKGIFDTEDKNEFLIGTIGGVQVEPILFGKKMFNVSFPMFIGGGVTALTTDDSDAFLDCGPFDSHDWEAVFVAQPGINGILNITNFLQFELSAKYRMSSDMVFRDTNYGNLNGFNIGAGIKLGYFAFGKKRKNK